MTTRAEIVAAARQWLGVPYHHQGRSRFGVDCAGLIVVVARSIGVDVSSDVRGYGLSPEGERLRRILETAARPVAFSRPGDILLFRFVALPQHLGIQTDVGVIHSHARVERVVEHRLNDVWRSRIVGRFAFPGVSD